MEFFRSTGIFGFGVVGLTVLLLAGLSVLPLLVGLEGAVVGRTAARAGIDAAAIQDPQEAAAMLAAGYRQANAVAYLGLAATGTLWGVCLCSLPIVRRRAPGP